MERLEEVRKNLHQTHMEDLVLLGKDGLNELNDKIEGFRKQLANDEGYNITQKIDGAPAVLIGHGLDGYPDVCVGIKSFLNDPKNALASNEEIDAKYSDDRAEMLKNCLRLAKSIPSGEAWQGDCLFLKSTLKERTINGVDYITFQPNKIIYAFSENTDGYEKIINSNFGIAMHTRYTQSNDGWSQSFRIDAGSLDVPEDIYILSPAISVSPNEADYSYDEIDKLYGKLKQLEASLLSNDDYENLVNNEAFMKYWNTFENANLSDKKQVNIDIKSFYSDLVSYVKEKKKKEFDSKILKLKTDKGKASATEKYEKEVAELDEIIRNNKKLLIVLVETLNTAANIKMLLLKGLLKVEQPYKTFLRRKSTGEYIDSDGEGLSLSDREGNIVKIVDRSTFSNANRDPDIESGFDHNESLEEDFNGDIKITGIFEKSINEALPSGDEDDFLDDESVYEWFDFIDCIEDYIESVGEVISSSTSNVLNSLSSYIDFYKDGDDKKVLFDLRVSDHKETRNAHKTRVKNASSINKKYNLVSVIVNNKRFDSYNEALNYVKSLIGGVQKEMHERKQTKRLTLEVQEDFTKNMVNTTANTDKDPAVKATKEYHKMKVKKLKKGQMIVSSLHEETNRYSKLI